MNRNDTMKKIAATIAIALAFITLSSADAEVKVANIFGDNMVLQRDAEFNIFGTATPGERVTVQLLDQTVATQAQADGKWLVKFQPIGTGPAFDVNIAGAENNIQLKNVVAGEVWICSGQSNMEWTVAWSGNPKEEIAAANWPLIRHVKINRATSITPNAEADNTGWQVCSPETAGDFTAVGYYFARHLHKELDCPIGLINTSWGGTIVETWISGESLSTHPDFTDRIAKMKEQSQESEEQRAKYAAQAKAFSDAWAAAMQTAGSSNLQENNVYDSKWGTHTVPGHWEGQGLKDYDGVVWYRRNVDIPAAAAGKPAQLMLGKIDDFDMTYVNGVQVGETKNWNTDRKYSVPAELVKEGKMSIAVMVTDTGVGGGFHGEAKNYSLAIEGQDPIALNGDWKFKVPDSFANLPERPKSSAMVGPNHPMLLHNAMVNPIIPVTFKGAIWYQGESNAGRAYQYRELFPLLIEDWRAKWNKEFPFYWVQLANFTPAAKQPGPSEWAELREAQSMTKSLPKTGEAVIIDIGEAADIHPKNKQDVGKRLALHALAKDYSKNDVVFSGPTYKSIQVDGNKVHVMFENTDGGLVAKGSDNGKLTRFEVAGEDKKFVFADAVIEGDKVVVSSADVANPVAVRYAWANNPEGCNLYNGAGLPACPFRTDDWPGATINRR